MSKKTNIVFWGGCEQKRFSFVKNGIFQKNCKTLFVFGRRKRAFVDTLLFLVISLFLQSGVGIHCFRKFRKIFVNFENFEIFEILKFVKFTFFLFNFKIYYIFRNFRNY